MKKELQLTERNLALIGFSLLYTERNEDNSIEREFYKEIPLQHIKGNQYPWLVHKTSIKITTSEEGQNVMKIVSSTGNNINFTYECTSSSSSSIVKSLIKAINEIDYKNQSYFNLKPVTSSLYKEYSKQYGSQNMGFDFCTLYVDIPNLEEIVAIHCQFGELTCEKVEGVYEASLIGLHTLIRDLQYLGDIEEDWLDTPTPKPELTEQDIDLALVKDVTLEDIKSFAKIFDRVIDILYKQVNEKTNQKRMATKA